MIKEINEMLESPEMETLMTLEEIKSSILEGKDTIGRGPIYELYVEIKSGIIEGKESIELKSKDFEQISVLKVSGYNFYQKNKKIIIDLNPEPEKEELFLKVINGMKYVNRANLKNGTIENVLLPSDSIWYLDKDSSYLLLYIIPNDGFVTYHFDHKNVYSLYESSYNMTKDEIETFLIKMVKKYLSFGGEVKCTFWRPEDMNLKQNLLFEK